MRSLRGIEAEYYLLFIATFGEFCHAVQYPQGVPSDEIKTIKQKLFSQIYGLVKISFFFDDLKSFRRRILKSVNYAIFKCNR